MAKRQGAYTLVTEHNPTVVGYGAVAGKKEGQGPLGDEFDIIFQDTHVGEQTWEQAESALQQEAFIYAMKRAGVTPRDVQYLFAGDLLNQNAASTFALRDMDIPLLGQFGACSTMGQTIAMATIFADSGVADLCGAVTSSHFCTAERQFRFPLEYGGQRPPTSQWTATAAGAVIIGRNTGRVSVKAVTVGRVQDMGITDINNMGAAMAPAAADTLAHFFADTDSRPDDYDVIATGDLGLVGSQLLKELMIQKEIPLGDRYTDCGLMLFDRRTQDVHAGGSGCGCSAGTLCAHFLPQLERGDIHSLLFAPTGALMSPTTSQQGESIPGICHALLFTSL